MLYKYYFVHITRKLLEKPFRKLGSNLILVYKVMTKSDKEIKNFSCEKKDCKRKIKVN